MKKQEEIKVDRKLPMGCSEVEKDKEIHLGPDGKTYHYADGGIVGYGGYTGI